MFGGIVVVMVWWWNEFMQEEPSMSRIELACASVTGLRKRHTKEFTRLSEMGNIAEVVCPVTTCVVPDVMCQEVMEHRPMDKKDQCVCSVVSLSKKVKRKARQDQLADKAIQKLAETKQKAKKSRRNVRMTI